MRTYTLEEYIFILIERCRIGKFTLDELKDRLVKTHIKINDESTVESTLENLVETNKLAINKKKEYYVPAINSIKFTNEYLQTKLLILNLDRSSTMISHQGLISILEENGSYNVTELPKSFYSLVEQGHVSEVKRVIKGRLHHLYGLAERDYYRYDLVYGTDVWNP